MHVHYWSVGSTARVPLPLTQAQISNHLIADWVPSFPATLGTAVFGWPAHLTHVVTDGGTPHLALHPVLRGTERQWKGVLSWMMGVAGTRHVLEQEGYRWIAPVSAFYPRAKQVTLPNWPNHFPIGVLTADRDPNVRARLRPDYLAIRQDASNPSLLEWAAVESKGTARALRKMSTCPAPWYNQARNITASANGIPIQIDRHLVVATRSCPDGVRQSTRCLEIRAWNSQDEIVSQAPRIAAVEVAATHLFGLCRNLGLRANAEGLASARWRTRRREPSDSRQTTLELQAPRVRPVLDNVERRLIAPEVELQAYRAKASAEAEDRVGARIQIEVERRPVIVELDEATVDLMLALGRAEDEETAIQAFEVANRALDSRPRQTRDEHGPKISSVSAGIRVIAPDLE